MLDDSLATVLFGDDVIHLMRRCSKFLWKQTILTAISRPLDHLPAQLNRGARGHAPCFWSTRALRRRTRCSKRSNVPSSAVSSAVNVPSRFFSRRISSRSCWQEESRKASTRCTSAPSARRSSNSSYTAWASRVAIIHSLTRGYALSTRHYPMVGLAGQYLYAPDTPVCAPCAILSVRSSRGPRGLSLPVRPASFPCAMW